MELCTVWQCDRCLQEEEDADYKHRFPDYHASFADILEASGDGMEMEHPLGGPHAGLEAPQQQGATQAEASSALSKQLMQGQLLDDIVLQHARSAVITSGIVSQSRACRMTAIQAGARNSIQKHDSKGSGSIAGCSGIWLVSVRSRRTSLPPF